MRADITDKATGELVKLQNLVKSPLRLMEQVGRRVEADLKRHFMMKDSLGNKKGWSRSHFWQKSVADKTKLSTVTPTSADIIVDSYEFVHKVQGGQITAKTSKYLSIPMTQEGKLSESPRKWSNGKLRFIPTRSGGILVDKDGISH